MKVINFTVDVVFQGPEYETVGTVYLNDYPLFSRRYKYVSREAAEVSVIGEFFDRLAALLSD